MNGAFLTVSEVATRWGCARSMVYEEIRADRLAALTIGTQGKRISRTEVQRFERDNTTRRAA